MADLIAGALEALAEGRVANPDQVIAVTRATVEDGPAAGCRIIDVDTCGGWGVRLLPDRGLDLGPATFAGVPLSWTSAVGPAGPLDSPGGMEWLEAFSGGLVTTCGLQNVGAPSEGHGLHGRVSHLRAGAVAVRRTVGGDTAAVEVTGTVEEVQALGVHLQLCRSVRIDAVTDTIDLVDTTINRTDVPVAAPILYHVNLGAPLWSGDAHLDLPGSEVIARDEDAEAGLAAWHRPPAVAADAAEWVFEHLATRGEEGWSHARVCSPATGLEVAIAWDTAALPRVHQWSHRRAGVYALAVEPANCSTRGRAADRQDGRLPHLQPGEHRTTRLRISAARLA